MAEVAYVSQVYGWALDASLDLEHGDRRNFIEMAVATPDVAPTHSVSQAWSPS